MHPPFIVSPRTQPVHALVAATYVASLGTSITTSQMAPTRPFAVSNALHDGRHRKAYQLLTFTAKSVQDTADAFGVLGSPVKLTCGVALTLVQALDGMVANRQLCSDLAELVTTHLGAIRKELDGAAKGDAKFRTLIEDYYKTLREVAEGVTAIAHRRRRSQLYHRHSASEELLGFKSRLDATFQVLMLQCGLQTRQMLEHIAADLRRILETQDEQSRVVASLNERVKSIEYNHGNLDQFLPRLTNFFGNSKVTSTHSLARDPINLLTPMHMLVKA